MSKRYFTSDFHMGDSMLLDADFMRGKNRPFKSTEKMNNAFLQSCNQRAKVYRDADGFIVDKDTIIHLGDFACTGSDRGFKGLDVSPQSLMYQINANFINVRGNHDANNSVKSAFNAINLNLGKRYPSVTAGHFPSYDKRSWQYIRKGFINLCGHVHSSWKHCLDLDRQVLNINVGVDVWKYKIVAEEELIQYIDSLLRKKPDDLFRCKMIDGKLVFSGERDGKHAKHATPTQTKIDKSSEKENEQHKK